MAEIKVPGVLWALLIVVVIALIHTFEPQIVANTPFNAPILDTVVVVLMGMLKGLDLTDVQLQQSLRLLSLLLRPKSVTGEAMRGVDSTVVINENEIPKPPSKLQKWLVG